MYERRRLIAAIATMLGVSTIARPIKAQPDNGTDSVLASPHAQALELILRTKQDQIAELEAAYFSHAKGDERRIHESLGAEAWWHDVPERHWSVRREFYPGTVDSTHWLTVAYSIDQKTIAVWTVDLRAGEVKDYRIQTVPSALPN